MFRCRICDISATSGESFRRLDISKLSYSVCVCCYFCIVGRLLPRMHPRKLGKLALCSASPPPVESDLQQHLRGRAHLRGLERKATAESCIFVKGFPQEASQESLQVFFNQSLGGVKSLWLSKSVSANESLSVEGEHSLLCNTHYCCVTLIIVVFQNCNTTTKLMISFLDSLFLKW